MRDKADDFEHSNKIIPSMINIALTKNLMPPGFASTPSIRRWYDLESATLRSGIYALNLNDIYRIIFHVQ